MNKTIFEKLGVKKEMRTFFVNAPASFLSESGLDAFDLKSRLSGKFEYLHFFATDQKNFHARFPVLKKHLAANGVLWVSWPKAGQNNTDLNIKNVIKLGYDYGLVESKAISIDSTWSALKFTHPIEGKAYHNSYGKLK